MYSKAILKFCLPLLLLFACANNSVLTEALENNYDAELAKTLGADDYGMRSYIFATLLTGPNDAAITDEKQRAELFKGHFANMGRMAEEGILVLADLLLKVRLSEVYLFSMLPLSKKPKP